MVVVFLYAAGGGGRGSFSHGSLPLERLMVEEAATCPVTISISKRPIHTDRKFTLANAFYGFQDSFNQHEKKKKVLFPSRRASVMVTDNHLPRAHTVEHVAC